MREIRFDKIGFNVLADTHNMCNSLSLKTWQLNKKTEEIRVIKQRTNAVCVTLSSVSNGVLQQKHLPCFSLQQNRDLKTILVISPENETEEVIAKNTDKKQKRVSINYSALCLTEFCQ